MKHRFPPPQPKFSRGYDRYDIYGFFHATQDEEYFVSSYLSLEAAQRGIELYKIFNARIVKTHFNFDIPF